MVFVIAVMAVLIVVICIKTDKKVDGKEFTHYYDLYNDFDPEYDSEELGDFIDLV